MSKRIVEIDFLKVLSCIMVICIHTDYFGFPDANPYLYSIFRCCIPVFFICSGFLMFRKEMTVKRAYNKMMKSIIVPACLTFLFLAVFDNYLTHGMNAIVADSKGVPDDIWGKIIYVIQNGTFIDIVDSGYSLWFMEAMIVIYILSPILSVLCSEDKRFSNIRHYLMFILFVNCFILSDIEKITGLNFQWNYSFQFYYLFYFLMGYELFLNYKNIRKSKKGLLYGILFYICGCMIIAAFYSLGYFVSIDRPTFDYNSTGTLISALGMVYIAINLDFSNSKIKKLLSYLSSYGLLMYCVHQPVVLLFRNNYLLRMNWIPSILQYLVHCIIVYSITLGLSILLRNIIKTIRHRVEQCRTF